MVLLRGCCLCNRLSVFNSRLFANKAHHRSVLSSSRSTPVLSSAVVRPYGSDPPKTTAQKVVIVGIPNPFLWLRARTYFFLFRTYFDNDFSIDEFTEAAKQAFSHVSRLLSQRKFEALDGLVTKDLIKKLEKKCNLLPSHHQKALSAEPEEIMYFTAADVGIYHDDEDRRYFCVLMKFWYLTSARLNDINEEGARIFQVSIGGAEGATETKRVLNATYEFQREFTKGVLPDWTITRIEHAKLLD